MTKKKTAAERRAKLPREVCYTREFQKAWERYNRAGRNDMNRAVEVMQLLFTNQEEIPPEYLDHQLEGDEWDGARELHIGGDFLLVYQLTDDDRVVTFTGLGTHAELFE
jgi:mRNA interferase YafQ